MGLLSRAGDLVYTFRFLRLLTTKFEDTTAYELGIIDEKGNRIKTKSITTGDEKSAFTPFHRLVFNIKKLMAKIPGGGSSVASYAAALYLIKENYIKNEDKLQEIINEHVDTELFLSESSSWFVTEDKTLSPGNYRVRNEKVVNTSFDTIVKVNDRIVVSEDCKPIGSIFGVDVYEATHYNSQQPVYVTVGEIYK
jgi:hypothetical protein